MATAAVASNRMAADEPRTGGNAGRQLLARHLIGRGIEVGPGHAPFPLPNHGCQIRYVDRWEPEENHRLFPELDGATFPKPDIVANVDIDRLSAVPDASEDFVICSHLLEHLAEPIGFIAEIHRVLRPGGVALILLPDRHLTFDKDRDPTPLEHLVAEHTAGVTSVSDEHIVEFICKVTPGREPASISAEEREAHRRRSIHVHCWDQQEFFPVLLHGSEHLGHRWELLETIAPSEIEPTNEFGFALRRSHSDLDTRVLALRFSENWDSMRAALATRQRSSMELQRAVNERDMRLRRIESSLAYRVSRRLRRHRGPSRPSIKP